jgi:hypothetical protein
LCRVSNTLPQKALESSALKERRKIAEMQKLSSRAENREAPLNRERLPGRYDGHLAQRRAYNRQQNIVLPYIEGSFENSERALRNHAVVK